MFLKKVGLDRKELRAWALYDCGNSAFATTIMVAILPTFYSEVAASNLEKHVATAYWGYTASIALIIITLIGPIAGTLADILSSKKRFLLLSTIIGMTGSLLLTTIEKGMWLQASLYYIIGNIGFATGEIFYESLLPNIASEKEIHKVSTSGYTLGYLGGGILLALNLSWILSPEFFGFNDKLSAIYASFISVAIWWGAFTIPVMRHVKEKSFHPTNEPTPKLGKAIPASFTQLLKTFREIKKYKHTFLFLLAFWAYSDGIGTVIKMGVIYGKEVGIATNDLIGAVLLIQFLGVPATFIFGLITEKFSPKNLLYFTLVIYTIITALAGFMNAAWQFWVFASVIAMVQGASQALSRSLYALMVPKHKTGEFFGFFSFSSKFAGIIGPLIFGVAAHTTGQGRVGVFSIVLLFIIGIILLSRVDIQKGKELVAKSELNHS